MSARDRILAKLRAAAPAANRSEPDVGAWFADHRPVESATEKAARFRNCIELAHAEVHAVSPGNWVQKLWEVLAAPYPQVMYLVSDQDRAEVLRYLDLSVVRRKRL